MLVLFYEDTKIIVVREYFPKNFLDPTEPELTRETRYDSNSLEPYQGKITSAYYMARVLEKELEINRSIQFSLQLPQSVLIFYGDEDSLWRCQNMDWMLYKNRFNLYIIPAYFNAEEVDGFVSRVFEQWNRSKCLL